MAIHLESWNSGPGRLAGKENSGEGSYYLISGFLEVESEMGVPVQVL